MANRVTYLHKNMINKRARELLEDVKDIIVGFLVSQIIQVLQNIHNQIYAFWALSRYIIKININFLHYETVCYYY